MTAIALPMARRLVRHLKITIAAALGACLERLEDWRRRYLDVCPDCGRSRWYGRPCK